VREHGLEQDEIERVVREGKSILRALLGSAGVVDLVHTSAWVK